MIEQLQDYQTNVDCKTYFKWDDSIRLNIFDEQELISKFDELKSKFKKPTLVDYIYAENISGLTVGFGLPAKTTLSWVSENGNPPYFISRGESPNDHSEIDFLYYGVGSPVRVSSLVDMSKLLPALIEFERTGQLPKCIEWE